MDSATNTGQRAGAQRRCPHCASERVGRQHRQGAEDYLLSMVGLFPYYCEKCEKRFRAARSRKSAASDSPSAGVICPRCAGGKAVRIPSAKVTPTMGNYLWRKVGIPGYRCPECRMRFFSLRRPVRSPR